MCYATNSKSLVVLTSPIEMAFMKANIPVFSNAKNYRKDPMVPLVVPTVNLSHLSLIPHQRKHHNLEKGFLVCNSNCAVIGIVIPFAALQEKFGPINTVSVVTMQAVSGKTPMDTKSSPRYDRTPCRALGPLQLLDRTETLADPSVP